MIFKQFFDQVSSTYTYLIGSEKSKQAIIIDPVLENVQEYIDTIHDLKLKLVATLETHLHADHITGSGKLAELENCKTMMGKETQAIEVDNRISDNDVLEFDDIKIKAIYTPGHTDDSYCFLMDDRVFTGDTLFINGTGRTDFQHGDAGQQYDSIFHRLLNLPEETKVYPAHDYNGKTVSSIGEEKRNNPRLQVSSKEEYIEMMNNLNLPNPKKMDIAVPANVKMGL